MSANPNQTNINTNRTFYAATLVPNFPYGAIFSQSGTAPILLETQATAIWSGAPALMTQTQNGSDYETIGGSQFFAYHLGNGGNEQKTCLYGSSNIFYQGSNGSGVGSIALAVNDTGLGTNSAFALNAVSSINTTTYTANSEALMSSLKGTFPTSFV